MENKNAKYVCEKCNFRTNNLFNWNKHLTTRKHLTDGGYNHTCLVCDMKFRHRQSLDRHNKKCISPETTCSDMVVYDQHMCQNEQTNNSIVSNSLTQQPPISSTTPQQITANLLLQLIGQNEELKNMLIEQQNRLVEQQTQLMEKQNRIETQLTEQHATHTKIMKYCRQPKTIRNNFNLNFFLNVQCKDALNISDFMNALEVEFSDVENVGRVGFAEGISQIIINRLQRLDLHKRPIHCKRETLFVKDENKWDKDDENRKIKRVISNVAQKNCRTLCKNITADMIMSDHPECEKNLMIMKNVNGGGGHYGREKNEEKIIRNVSQFVELQDKCDIDLDDSIMDTTTTNPIVINNVSM